MAKARGSRSPDGWTRAGTVRSRVTGVPPSECAPPQELGRVVKIHCEDLWVKQENRQIGGPLPLESGPSTACGAVAGRVGMRDAAPSVTKLSGQAASATG